LINRQASTNQIRDLIVEIVNTKNPDTTTEIVKLVRHKYSLPEEEIITILLQLEAEDKIHFAKKTLHTTNMKSEKLFSFKLIWFWITIAISTVTIAAVFLIPENDYPLTYLRQTLGTVFVLFLPGYAFLKTLYPSKVPIATLSENLDAVERVAFGIGLSIALVAIVGLILNYTPWGIRLTPVTLSLFALTLVFAVVGVFREYQAKAMKFN
jgi:uncharacterized membrane protein